MCNRDRRGRVRASEITLSRAARCSGRGRARGGTHSDVNAHAAGFLAMRQPGPPWTGSRELNNPQRSRAVQQEGTRAGWHAQRRECARSRVPDDAAPFRLFHEKSTCTIFRVCATRPDDRPASAANCYPSHVRLFKFIEKMERHGIARHLAACAFALLCVPPRARPLLLHRAAPLRVIPFTQTRPRQSRLLHCQEPGRVHIHVTVCAPPRASYPAAAHGPAKGYFTCANPSAVVPVTHPPPSSAPRLAFSRLSATSPRRTFAPLSATGLMFRQAGISPEIYVS